jgi:hypothetical protein
MIKSDKSFVDVARHGKVDFAVLVIPIDGEAEIACTLPVGVTFVILLEYCKEIFGICFVDVPYFKIINNEGETDRLPFVSSESRGDCTLCVTCFEESIC